METKSNFFLTADEWDDYALKFVRREVRRGARYDAFIIDPPKFGRGPKGEIWKIRDWCHSRESGNPVAYEYWNC